MTALEQLLVSGKELNKDLVAEILAPHLRIDADTCEVLPTATWPSQSAETKALLYLIARKAMVALELPLRTEGATPQEIELATGVVGGTLRPVLKRLLDKHSLTRSRDGRYSVPNHALESIKSTVGGQQRRPVR